LKIKGVKEMNWYFHVLSKYAVFKGRARRKEYWVFTSINALIISFCGVLSQIVHPVIVSPMTFLGIGIFFSLILFLPGIALCVRRLHDTDHSGWWLLPILVPILGVPFFLYFTLKNSSYGENQYGENPKGIDNDVEKDFNKPVIPDFNKTISKTYPKKTTVKQIPSHSKRERSKMKEKINITLNENELYEQVWREIEENKTDLGLWAKCFSTCEGDENKTKALYVSKRVFGLKENLQKQIINQERKAKEDAEKKIEKDLASQKLAKKFLTFEGRTDDIFIFKKTIETMPTFFPKILDKFGYKLVQNKDREEMWSIHLPSGSETKMVYDLFDLRKEIRKIVEKEYKTTWKCDCGAETEVAFSNCSKCRKFKP
jgi:uncharacterized membrane protein YhaH (DUF805 family)